MRARIRWAIYLLVFLSVLIPMLTGFSFPVGRISESTQAVFDYIESLPEGSVVAISFDYGPSVIPDVQPIAKALIAHCFKRNLKVMGFALWPTGEPLGRRAFEEVAEMMGKVYGEDYVYFGYRAGYSTVMLQMGEDIRKVFEQDYRKTPTDRIPMMKHIRNYKDIDLLVDLAAGDSVETWIVYAYTKFGQKLAAGVTGVIVSQMYPYIQAGQLVGVIPAMRGGAEYEELIDYSKLLGEPGMAKTGMSIQSIVHLLLMILIAIGNLEFVMMRRRR